MRTLALLLALPVALAQAQTAPAPAEPSVEQTANPELVGQLVNELGITPRQAEGAAGSLFGVAKSRLGADDFAKVAGAVPNMEGLLKAAPAADAKAAAAAALAGSGTGAGGLGTMAAAAGAMSKLGLKPDMIAKLTPALVKFVQTKGGAEVASLLAGALT
jgi:hypothetical protein